MHGVVQKFQWIIVVMEDADLELALDGAVWGAFGTTGQRCTATSRLILHRDIKEKFTTMLYERTSKLRLGAGTESNTDIGPIVNEKQLQQVSKYLDIAREEGAKVLIGGEIASEGSLKNGYFFQPTILDDVTPDMRVARKEIFGPVVALIEVSSFEEAIAILNDSNYGLSSSVYTRDINRAFTAMHDIEAGITYISAQGAQLCLQRCLRRQDTLHCTKDNQSAAPSRHCFNSFKNCSAYPGKLIAMIRIMVRRPA